MVPQRVARIEAVVPEQNKASMWKDFLAGTAAGCSAIAISQPMDVVRVNMQTATQRIGMAQCMTKLVKAEGVRGLYKGMAPPLVATGFLMAVMFSTRSACERTLRKEIGGGQQWSMRHDFICGACGGLAQSLLANPMEHVKVRLQVQRGNTFSAATMAQHLYRTEGLKKLILTGLPCTVVRDVIGYGTFLALAEEAFRQVTPEGQTKKDLGFGTIMLVGMVTCVWYWLPVFPADVIKTRLQNDPMGIYNGTLDCAQKTYHKEGVRGLFKGQGATLVYAIPRNAAKLGAFEIARHLLYQAI